MNRTRALLFVAMSIVAWALPISPATAETGKDIVGYWTIVSITVGEGDKKVEPYGPNPTGTHVYEANGRFAIVITRRGLPQFASKNRETGSAEENKAVVGGSFAAFGTYTTNDADKSMTIRIEGSTFPNFNGTSQKRGFAISGDELTITNPTPSGGGGIAKIVLKRTK